MGVLQGDDAGEGMVGSQVSQELGVVRLELVVRTAVLRPVKVQIVNHARSIHIYCRKNDIFSDKILIINLLFSQLNPSLGFQDLEHFASASAYVSLMSSASLASVALLPSMQSYQ